MFGFFKGLFDDPAAPGDKTLEGNKYQTMNPPSPYLTRIQGDDGESVPAHYALISPSDIPADGVLDKVTNETAKSRFYAIVQAHSEEVGALSGKPIAEVRAALEALEQRPNKI